MAYSTSARRGNATRRGWNTATASTSGATVAGVLGDDAVSVGHTDDLEMMNGRRTGVGEDAAAGRPVEQRAVVVRRRPPLRIPYIQPAELDRKDRGLQLIEAAVAPRNVVHMPRAR